jgi:hypothetical protein
MSEPLDERSERYLFDGGEPADPDVARLEKLLARYRYRPAPPAAARRDLLVEPRWIQAALAAAALFVAVMLGLRLAGPSRGAWRVRGAEDAGWLERGEWLEAGASGAQLEVGELGVVELRPGARVRLDDEGEERHALYLAQGAVRATITAEPRAFQIGTPSGLSIDLGCLYDLEVDGEGVAHLHVETGEVAFEAEGRTVFVPAGYATRSLPGSGPLVPVHVLADLALEELVRRVEASAPVGAQDLARVAELNDSVVLYHLLRARDPAVRAAALEPLLLLERLPVELSAQAVLRDDAAWRAWHDAEVLSFAHAWARAPVRPR